MIVSLIFSLLMASTAPNVGPPEAMKSGKLSYSKWVNCVLDKSGRYAKLDEPAEVIAQSAVAQCTDFREEYKRTLDAISIDGKVKMTDETKDKVISDRTLELQNHAISNVLEIRLKKASKG